MRRGVGAARASGECERVMRANSKHKRRSLLDECVRNDKGRGAYNVVCVVLDSTRDGRGRRSGERIAISVRGERGAWCIGADRKRADRERVGERMERLQKEGDVHEGGCRQRCFEAQREGVSGMTG